MNFRVKSKRSRLQRCPFQASQITHSFYEREVNAKLIREKPNIIYLTNPFTILDLQNMFYDTPEQIKISQSPDREALKL